MEENRENGRVRSPIWGLFYKKHKKISLFLEKKMLQTCKFQKYTYFCSMKNLPAGDISKTIRTEWS
ncbi:hypothetical protein DW079_06365 [Segatella copri]|uniref:Uncharacterized protein n=1 Tax=Segatella copri TaxID=165179 RepID=A0A3R6ILU2_9BACT|nr:hypothetical protein DW079_06365 [Segatella copri]